MQYALYAIRLKLLKIRIKNHEVWLNNCQLQELFHVGNPTRASKVNWKTNHCTTNYDIYMPSSSSSLFTSKEEADLKSKHSSKYFGSIVLKFLKQYKYLWVRHRVNNKYVFLFKVTQILLTNSLDSQLFSIYYQSLKSSTYLK